jgi:hypothetical protein
MLVVSPRGCQVLVDQMPIYRVARCCQIEQVFKTKDLLCGSRWYGTSHSSQPAGTLLLLFFFFVDQDLAV